MNSVGGFPINSTVFEILIGGFIVILGVEGAHTHMHTEAYILS